MLLQVTKYKSDRAQNQGDSSVNKEAIYQRCLLGKETSHLGDQHSTSAQNPRPEENVTSGISPKL